MPDFVTFAILGLVQGLTEFLPVSSSGHLIVARSLLGMQSADGLAVDAILQFGTILAVIVYFYKDLFKLAYTALHYVARKPIEREDGQLLIALIVGTIPGVLVGLLLESTMETVFRNPVLVAYALLAGSALFVVAEYAMKRIGKNLSLSAVGWKQGLVIGLYQCIALVPGMSRSGMTISGGLFLGLSREAAARFGFLLSVPIIAGSGLKKLFDLGTSGALVSIEIPLIVGTFVAFVAGLIAIHGLLMFVKSRPLHVFAGYRVLLAIVILAFPFV